MCGASYGERSQERTNRRNGYRDRDFDTRTGTIEISIPQVPRRLLLPRVAPGAARRAERALVQVMAECSMKGVSTRRVDGLIKTLGIEGISKSQISSLAKSLDETVEAFRSRGDEDRVLDGDRGLGAAASGPEPRVLGGEVGPPRP